MLIHYLFKVIYFIYSFKSDKLKQQPEASPDVNSKSASTFTGKINILIFAVLKMCKNYS
jgi:hypothetical protein